MRLFVIKNVFDWASRIYSTYIIIHVFKTNIYMGMYMSLINLYDGFKHPIPYFLGSVKFNVSGGGGDGSACYLPSNNWPWPQDNKINQSHQPASFVLELVLPAMRNDPLQVCFVLLWWYQGTWLASCYPLTNPTLYLANSKLTFFYLMVQLSVFR